MGDRKRVVILSGFKMCLETIQIYLAKRLNGRAADQKKAALVAGLF